MTEQNRNLILRVASAVVLLPVCLYLVWRGGFWTAALTGVVGAGCASEYYLLTQKRLSFAGWVGVAAALGMPLLPALAEAGNFSGNAGAACLFWVGAFFLFAWISQLWSGDLPGAPQSVGHLTTGFLYAGLGMASVAALRLRPDGFSWVVAVLIVTWANDTLAYFAGRLFGRHKLYEAVSPKKTWEGFAGGMVGSVGGLFLYRTLASTPLTAADCVLLGVAGGILGPIGDLCESMLKRAYGAKDSGRLIPGHGGLLDRIDALLFNAPMGLFYLVAVRPLLG
jgi:phosphatidate cytidylyltransferase